jgi:hypothetical protein
MGKILDALPCVWCEQLPRIDVYDGGPEWYVGCENSDCVYLPCTDLRVTRHAAVAAWNREMERIRKIQAQP